MSMWGTLLPIPVLPLGGGLVGVVEVVVPPDPDPDPAYSSFKVSMRKKR
jgi:hypothetical protein